jgi:uncharacterized protein
MSIARFIIPLLILFCVEWMAWDTFSSWSKSLHAPWNGCLKWTYIILTLGFWVFFFSFPILRNMTEPRWLRSIVSLIVMAILIAKLAMILPVLLDYITRLFSWIVSLFFRANNTPAFIEKGMTRSHFLRNTGLVFGGSFFGLVLYGASNRYNYRIRNVKVPLANLPEAFRSLKIVQISDIHSGSFTSPKDVLAGVERINGEQPDLIFFTGDLVNNVADEMKDYIEVFSQLKAKYGVFSILGNHDYGDYSQWDSPRAKLENLNRLKAIHKEMGWQLMLNEHVILNINGSDLGIIGVENISGKGNFHTYGDLNQAMQDLPKTAANILLSHDPSHWDTAVKNSDWPIDLTLSGHTHGMQFGIEIPGIKWSPVQYMYKYWAGLYQENNKHIYVNRGFGFLGYPGRVGILPEITLIQFV